MLILFVALETAAPPDKIGMPRNDDGGGVVQGSTRNPVNIIIPLYLPLLVGEVVLS